MNTVWVLGDAVVDLLPDGEQHYLRCPGGAPANVSVAIARLGGKSAFIGRVGNDPLGRFLKTTLQQEQVNTDFMHLDDQHRTSTVIVDLDPTGERTFTFMVNPSADQFLQQADLPHFSASEWLHFCSIALINQPSRNTTQQAAQQIKQAGGFVSFDPNLRPSLWPSQQQMIDEVNKMAELGTMLAHVDGGVPNLRIELPKLNEYYLGQLIYFFEKACGISGYLLGVNPFDQPGVEAYKKNMFALLEKPGYEEATKAIKSRL